MNNFSNSNSHTNPNATKQPGMSTGHTQPQAEAEADVLEDILAAAAFQPIATTIPAGGMHSLDRGSGTSLIDYILDGAAARKHREVLRHIRDVGIETMEGMNITSMIAADMVANSLETEHTMEQLIRQYSDSKFVAASAALYTQLGRAIQMQTVPAIAQTGANRIKNKIESR